MSLIFWFPMTNNSIENKGVDFADVTPTDISISTNGILGNCSEFNTATSKIVLSNYDFTSFFLGDYSICFWIYDDKNADRTCYVTTYNYDGANGFTLEKLAS